MILAEKTIINTMLLIDLLRHISLLSHHRFYWLAFLVAGVGLLLAALFYQHVLNELPCVMCIQIRLWISLLVVVAIFGYLFRETWLKNSLMHFFNWVVSIGLTERSYNLLGTERGYIFGDCGFSLGMPAWFAIEDWLPWLYRVETSCGYTPEIIFGITMAEVLMLMSVCLLLLTSLIFVASMFRSEADR